LILIKEVRDTFLGIVHALPKGSCGQIVNYSVWSGKLVVGEVVWVIYIGIYRGGK
jgi:hypothetical protein